MFGRLRMLGRLGRLGTESKTLVGRERETHWYGKVKLCRIRREAEEGGVGGVWLHLPGDDGTGPGQEAGAEGEEGGAGRLVL